MTSDIDAHTISSITYISPPHTCRAHYSAGDSAGLHTVWTLPTCPADPSPTDVVSNSRYGPCKYRETHHGWGIIDLINFDIKRSQLNFDKWKKNQF